MNNFFLDTAQIKVKQVKEVFEMLIDWETANKYKIFNTTDEEIGFAAEKSNGFFHKVIRNIMRSHRSITIDIWDKNKKHILRGNRPWYFFFSDLKVLDNSDITIGEIKTRFGFFKRKYDLIDANQHVFARIESFRWRLWTFTIYDNVGNEVGVISKKWGGILKEAFTDSDQFVIDFSKYNWTVEQKAILLFSCLSIDLDFFEDNSGSVLSLFD